MKERSALERLIRYAKVMTPSDEFSGTTPSTSCQFTLANLIVEELKHMGVENAYVDGKCYIYASIPASQGLEDRPTIGFIAHMDTVDEYVDQEVKPLVWEDYDGKDVILPSGRIISTMDFPHLPSMKGRTLVTSDGNTILGSDDKAGIAEIMTMAERIIISGMPHGKICIGFTPDEEIGCGADHFNIKRFGADFAYTVDGGPEGSIEYENFNAASVHFGVKGKGVHPGSSKNIMINASLVAIEVNDMLPKVEVPGMTEGYEGFYHLLSMKGDVAEAELSYIIRDHDATEFAHKLDLIPYIVETINRRYGEGTVTATVKEQYRNMREKIEPHMHLIENAIKATEEAGLTSKILPIRGGTDGARLSFMGLPCPNLGTGGYAYHGPYEHNSAEGMESVVQILLGIVKKYAE